MHFYLRRLIMKRFHLLIAVAMITSAVSMKMFAQEPAGIACSGTKVQGQNAVTCGSSAGGSYAFVDASGWVNQNQKGDICAVISDILSNATPLGQPVTIDARG